MYYKYRIVGIISTRTCIQILIEMGTYICVGYGVARGRQLKTKLQGFLQKKIFFYIREHAH